MRRKFLEPYTVWEGTPMWCYKAILYIAIPITVILGIMQIPGMLGTIATLSGTNLAWVGWADLIFSIAAIAIFSVAFAGLICRKKYGVVMLLMAYPFSAIYQIYNIWAAGIIGAGGEVVVPAMSGILSALVWFPIAYIYFWKRRFLFPGRVHAVKEETQAAPAAAPVEIVKNEEVLPPVPAQVPAQETIKEPEKAPEEAPEQEQAPIQAPIQESEKAQAPKRKSHLNVLLLVLCATFAVTSVGLTAGLIFKSTELSHKSDEVETITDDLKTAERKVRSLENNRLTHDGHKAIIASGSNLYHEPFCDCVKTAKWYWVYTEKECWINGYEPCFCWIGHPF